MSDSALPETPAAAGTWTLLRGLDAADADRPAIEVMSTIAWEGSALDPDTIMAGDFLALL